MEATWCTVLVVSRTRRVGSRRSGAVSPWMARIMTVSQRTSSLSATRQVKWFGARTSLQLLDGRIVILEIAVLEEDQVMVSMRLYAILAESVSALIAGSFDLFSLMPWLLAVGDALLVRG